MGRIFNMDNPFFTFMGRFADLLILNLIFLLCCIPIVTIGPALTALYYTVIRVTNKEEPYIVRSFFKSFRLNLKQGMIIWIGYLLAAVILYVDSCIMKQITPSVITTVISVGQIALSVFIAMMFSYSFPVLSRFENSVKATVKNALLMSIRHLPYTILILALPAAAIVATFLNSYTFVYGLLIWFLIGFSLIAFLQSFLFNRIFRLYMPSEEEDAVSVTETETEASPEKDVWADVFTSDK